MSHDIDKPLETVIAAVSEAVSDFSTTAASNKTNILRVVETSRKFSDTLASDGELSTADGSPKSDGASSSSPIGGRRGSVDMMKSKEFPDVGHIQPTVSTNAREITKLYNDWEQTDETPNSKSGNNSSPSNNNTTIGDSSSTFDPKVMTNCDIGDTIWLGFHCILSLTKSLYGLYASNTIGTSTTSSSNNDYIHQIKSLVDGAFAPSLALLQHFLKRFPGSPNICKKTLSGYIYLANVALPLNKPDELQRKAILTSLCKLSLPQWGKKDTCSQLLDHHVQSLSSIFLIMHTNHNYILGDWHIVLWTLEFLSTISLSSSKLSAECQKMAMLMSMCFLRVSSFTTCLSNASLENFVDVLIEISSSSCERKSDVPQNANSSNVVGQSKNNNNNNDDDETNDSTDPNLRESFGGKLMSFAGRALSAGLGTNTVPMGASSSSSSDIDAGTTDMADSTTAQRTRPSKSFSDDFCEAAFSRLVAAQSTTRKEVFFSLPFGLVALTDIALMNSFRFDVFGKSVIAHLCDLSATALSSSVRSFAMDMLACLITSQLSRQEGDAPSKTGLTRIISNPASVEEYLLVEPLNSMREKNNMRTEEAVRVAAAQSMDSGTAAFSQSDLLNPLCETITKTNERDTAEAGLNALHIILEGVGHNINGDSWPPIIEGISALSGKPTNSQSAELLPIDRSIPDWATASSLAFRCLKLIVDDFLDQLLLGLPNESSDITRNSLVDCCASFGSSTHDVNTSLTATGMLWTIADQDPSQSSLDRVLSKLAYLASDSRSEVRNCSVNTLFSCIVGLGHRFTPDQWRACFEQTIFGVLDKVKALGEEQSPERGAGDNKSTSSRYRVAIHHSRDSAGKQWATTQAMTLRGLERVLRQFFVQLLATTEDSTESGNVSSDDSLHWFESAWLRVLDSSFECATLSGGREILELRLAGVDLLILCSQLSCKAGIQAATTPARVGTNMMVINGALRSIKSTKADSQKGVDMSQSALPVLSDNLSARRDRLFSMSFSSLEKFHVHLENGNEEEVQAQIAFSESLLLQVLTKLSQGLSKLYECCKDNEMAPKKKRHSKTSEDVADVETRFVDLVDLVVWSAMGDNGARFLTQAQRISLELLQTMATQSSIKAFQTLVIMGGEAYFCLPSADHNNSGPAHESVEQEAAKLVSALFLNKGVSKETKVSALCDVLDKFVLSVSDGRRRNDDTPDSDDSFQPSLQFNLFVPILKGGVQAAIEIEDENTNGDGLEQLELCDKFWSKTLVSLSCCLAPLTKSGFYAPHTNATLDIIRNCVTTIPVRKHEDLGKILADGALKSVEVAKSTSLSESSSRRGSSDNGSVNDDEDALRIFRACFTSLFKFQANENLLFSISDSFLSNAIAAACNEPENLEEESSELLDVDEEVGFAVCEAIKTVPGLKNLAIGLFPRFCTLTNVGSDRLRREAGAVLGSVDLNSVIQRMEEAEKRADVAEAANSKLQEEFDELETYCSNLKAENDELRQEVAIFSERSTFT